VAYRFRSEVWLYNGDSAWHFVTLPLDQADEIDEITMFNTRGFGSVRVAVTIGKTTWSTSIFPDKKEASYVLPIKKAVRVAERLQVGDVVEISLDLVDVEGT
jgi:hypothetical protein